MRTNYVIAFANNDSFDSADRVKELEMLGFNIKFCGDASQVLRLFSLPDGERPDMLITDGMLGYGEEFTEMETNGGIDTGVALYNRLRADHPELPVVTYTTKNRTFKELQAIKDPRMIAISEFCNDPIAEILAAAQRLLS